MTAGSAVCVENDADDAEAWRTLWRWQKGGTQEEKRAFILHSGAALTLFWRVGPVACSALVPLLPSFADTVIQAMQAFGDHARGNVPN